MSGNSNGSLGAGIMHRVKIFIRKKIAIHVTFPSLLLQSHFLIVMCNTMSFQNALIGSLLF